LKKAILAKKIGMTQIFLENGILVPVTVLEAGPCVVVQKKTMANDGYEAVQVGFVDVKLRKTRERPGNKSEKTEEPKTDGMPGKRKKAVQSKAAGESAMNIPKGKEPAVTRPILGHFTKVGLMPKKYLKEFRLDDISGLEVGNEIKADTFKAGERVDISGTSKGKGYQGAIKRYGQHRGPMAHGSKYHRGLGSMGAATSPGRVPKGKKMPGHMGAKKITIQNLEIARVDAERNLLLVKGAVPGANGTVLSVKNTVKA
jgi:large subunit ribosomal protein L3